MLHLFPNNNMNKTTLLTIVAIACAVDAHGALTFTGLSDNAVTIQPETSTGLNEIYVIENAVGTTVQYQSTAGNSITWYKFSSLGGGYAEVIGNVSRSGNTFSIAADAQDMGYIIDDGDRRYCYWVVNYANHELRLDGLAVSTENDCDRTTLVPSGYGDKINYYTINGQARELSRELTVSYQTLEYSEDATEWSSVNASATVASFSSVITVTAPLCDTNFTLSGDRFTRIWGREQSVSSNIFSTNAVSATTYATQTEHTADNEQRQETSSLGGSAPCEIKFTAIPTDAAVYHEWEFSSSSEFDNILDRYTQNEFTYTFNNQGTTYVKYIAGDSAGNCFYESDIYTVSIGESKLECPNAFSPDNQDGVNDEWKVSYASLISFECHIFNRWGTEMCSFTDPSQGWDGKYRGKFVPTGTYFYVIKAVGSDGVKYNKSGDINILRTRQRTTSSGETE
jgi:gliding motility-associated-like protein